MLASVCAYVCISSVKGVESTDHSPAMSTAAASPYLPLTPDINSPVSASDRQHRGSSVNSLPTVGICDKQQPSSSSLTHGHTRHRSVDTVLADIVPDLSETIDTDFLHVARSHVFVFYLYFTFLCFITLPAKKALRL